MMQTHFPLSIQMCFSWARLDLDRFGAGERDGGSAAYAVAIDIVANGPAVVVPVGIDVPPHSTRMRHAWQWS